MSYVSNSSGLCVLGGLCTLRRCCANFSFLASIVLLNSDSLFKASLSLKLEKICNLLAVRPT